MYISGPSSFPHQLPFKCGIQPIYVAVENGPASILARHLLEILAKQKFHETQTYKLRNDLGEREEATYFTFCADHIKRSELVYGTT